jgi:hypothetical protein
MDEALEEVGYGNQWDRTVSDLAKRKSATDVVDIERLNEYNRKHPEANRLAVNRWAENNLEKNKHLIGTVCPKCNEREITEWYAKWMLNPTCNKCRKEKKNG